MPSADLLAASAGRPRIRQQLWPAVLTGLSLVGGCCLAASRVEADSPRGTRAEATVARRAGAQTPAPSEASRPSPDAGVARARALLRAGDPAAAAAVLEAVLEAAPGHGPARLLAGRLALERGELETACEHLEIATAAELQRPYLAWHLLGRVRLRLGEPGPAGEAWDRALAGAPRFVPALVGRALAAMRLGDAERAAGDLERAVSLGGSLGERLDGPPGEAEDLAPAAPAPEATLLLAELRLFEERSEEAAALLEGLGSAPGAPAELALAARLLLLAAAGDPGSHAELRQTVTENLHLGRALLALGIARLRAGDEDAAARAFRAALETDDEDPVPWLHLRRLGGQEAPPPGDRPAPDALYPAPFHDLPSRLGTAQRHLQEGDAAAARDLAAAILDRRPHHPAARLLWTLAAERQEDHWAALAGYRALLDRLPGLPALEARAARVARSLGALELAACLAERALEALPGDAPLHFLRAAIAADAGDHDAAAESSRRAIALGLEEAPVYLTLGLAEFERMRTAESIAAYARALELSPEADRAIPRFALASLSGAETAALRDLLAARLEAAPEDEGALYGLGVIALREGDLERARGHFERLAALAPDDPEVLYNLGSVYLRLGDRERGDAAMERFAELKAAEERAWLEHNRSHALRLEAQDAAAAGDFVAAIRLYDELAAAGVADLDDYVAAGAACLQAGDPRRAYGWFEQVLTVAPARPAALSGVAEAADTLGRTEVAQQARERLALLAWPGACEPR